MPVNAPVEAEIRIASRDVGFVRPGDRCVLKIDAFNYMEHGTAEGTVRWISDNAFTTDDNSQPVDAYYKARCSVDAMHFVDVPPKFRLIPGMTLQADVNVGRARLPCICWAASCGSSARRCESRENRDSSTQILASAIKIRSCAIDAGSGMPSAVQTQNERRIIAILSGGPIGARAG